MDQYSFLNTAHTAYFAELYDQYLINPEHVESKKEKLAFGGVEVPDNMFLEIPRLDTNDYPKSS